MLIHDFRLRPADILYTIFAGLLFATVIQTVQTDIIPIPYISNLVAITFIFFYLTMIVKKSLLVSFVLAASAFAIALVIELSVIYLVKLIFPDFPAVREPVPLIFYILLVYVFSAGVSISLIKVLRKRLSSITQVGSLQSTFALIVAILLLFFQVTITVQYFLGYTASLFSWSGLFILSYTLAAVVCFWFYAKFQKEKSTLRKRDAEQKILRHYLSETELQQAATRKFKHDYQNILHSIRGFLDEKNYEGLEEYYHNKIEPASAIITKNNFALEGLRRVIDYEIKGILMAKLMMAQNMGIEVSFEAYEDIENIPVDSIAFVRIIGIIFDNAIEEVEALGGGHILVACYKDGTGIVFVVQNTCRPDIQNLRELKQAGFSTKGENRGLGLSNLAEIVADNSDVLTLQTSISDGTFTQKLWIGGAE